MPRQAALLAHVFPVLLQVEAVADAPRPSVDVRDPQELRSRLFGAIRELMSRLADRRPLVLLIDDLQWADVDSIALLAEVMRPPDAPTLLLVATVRTSAGVEAAAQAMELMAAVRADARSIPLDRMSHAEACQLAKLLARKIAAPSHVDVQLIAQEAAGHPLFIDELIRHSGFQPTEAGPILPLEEALWTRISQLDPEVKRLVELVALAGGPLHQYTAARAASLEFATFSKHVALLRVAHLVRTSGMRGSDRIEPYHDRVRASVLTHLDSEQCKHYHRRLALALESTRQADPESLAVHWREAGELSKAADYATRAADKATRALAFDRAAQLYQLCLDLASSSVPQTRQLRVRLGDALANAGRGAEAAHAYLLAAGESDAIDAIDLRRRAAEQLLRSGHVDEGLKVLRDVLNSVGMKLAPTPLRALNSLVLRRAQIRLRGLRFRLRQRSQISPDELTRIDICWSAAAGLGMIDTIRGADFQTLNLLLALRAGEPYRIARAFAMEAAFSSTAGTKGGDRSEKLLLEARHLAEQIDDPHAIGLVMLVEGVASFQLGRWRRARDLITRAEAIFRERCTGVAWELASGHVFRLGALYYLGEYAELAQSVPALILEAEARGDLYATTNLRLTHMNAAWLVGDDAAGARREAALAMQRWSARGYLAQHYYNLFAETNTDLYSGDGEAAWQRICREWPALKHSLFLRVQVVRVEALHLRARAALGAAEHDGPEREELLREAEEDARQLEREEQPSASALATLVRAGVASGRGQEALALHLLVEAARALEACDMRSFAAAARYRAGRILGGDEGRGRVDEALTWLRSERVKKAEQMVGLLAPGFKP
jgi:hypothetical protein